MSNTKIHVLHRLVEAMQFVKMAPAHASQSTTVIRM